MPLPETVDCHSCGRETALDAGRCACGARFDPLLRASEAALENLEHKESVVLEKDIIGDPTESGYRRSRLGKPKGQNRDYRLGASFFEGDEEAEKEDEEETSSHSFDVDVVSLPSFVGIGTPSFENVAVSIPTPANLRVPSFRLGVPSFGGVSTPYVGAGALSHGDVEEKAVKENGDTDAGTDSRELHLREYKDRYTLHWDAHPARSPMHAVRDAPDYGAACVAAVGLAAAAVGSRVVKRRKRQD